MPRIGPWELIAILAIVLIIFGAGKLPQIGKSMGDAMREFRKGSHVEDESAKVGAAAKKEEKSP